VGLVTLSSFLLRDFEEKSLIGSQINKTANMQE
jgi:hypothetical protein